MTVTVTVDTTYDAILPYGGGAQVYRCEVLPETVAPATYAAHGSSVHLTRKTLPMPTIEYLTPASLATRRAALLAGGVVA